MLAYMGHTQRQTNSPPESNSIGSDGSGLFLIEGAGTEDAEGVTVSSEG